MKTPYEILGVHRRADDATIRAALHRTAKRYHPDLHAEDPAAEQYLKEAMAAYQVLKNPQQRAAYDRYLRRRTQRTGRLLRTGFASAGLASAIVIALAVWLVRPQQPRAPGLEQTIAVAAAEKRETPEVVVSGSSRVPTQERVANRKDERDPAAPEAALLAEWREIAGKGDPLAVWAFAAHNPQAPEAELARSWLLRLVDATEDAAFLNTLRTDAGGILAQHAQQRLDALAHLVSAAAGREEATGVAAKGGRQEEDASSKGAAFYLERGVRRIGASDFDRAIADFSEAIRLEPDNAAAYGHRAAAWCRKGHSDRALADYEAVIRIDPANAVALRERGALWRRSGAPDRALLDLDQAIRLGFSDAAAYNERGQVWLDKANYERAIADFDRAIKLDPNLASAYFNRAVALRGKGDLYGASADFKVAISLDPSIAALLSQAQR